MFTSTLLLALATAVTARKCHDVSIPISISATNIDFNLPPPATDIDVANLLLNLAENSANYVPTILVGVSNFPKKASTNKPQCLEVPSSRS